MNLRYQTYIGAAIADIFSALAALRIRVFREFPYLYEGTLAYEKEYLKTYSDAKRAFLCLVYDQNTLIGATTAIPLSDETEEVKAPFLKAGMDINRIFYFGESILLAEYRGLGIGHRFFDAREAHARHFGDYDTTCFCAVERPHDHPLRPHDYRPLNDFWAKRGYLKNETLNTTFSWKDLDEREESLKKMTFYLRPALLALI